MHLWSCTSRFRYVPAPPDAPAPSPHSLQVAGHLFEGEGEPGVRRVCLLAAAAAVPAHTSPPPLLPRHGKQQAAPIVLGRAQQGRCCRCCLPLIMLTRLLFALCSLARCHSLRRWQGGVAGR